MIQAVDYSRDAVSRGTIGLQRSPESRRYYSPARSKALAATHAAILEAVMTCLRAGCFQPTAAEIVALAGVSRKTVSKHFGPLHLLMRVVARERWREVVPLLPFPVPEGVNPRSVVWTVLVGRPET